MTLVLVPTILAGSIASVFGLGTIALVLSRLLWVRGARDDDAAAQQIDRAAVLLQGRDAIS